MSSKVYHDRSDTVEAARWLGSVPGVVTVLVLAAAFLASPLGLFAQMVGAEEGPETTPDRVTAIRAGDIIRLRVWREPEYSGDFTVSERGVAVFPRIGARQVVGRGGESLRDDLVRAYSAFLNHESIEVTVLRRVQVLGAVRNPGIYPVDATLTVSDVIALAGGATVEGRRDRVELWRGGSAMVARLNGTDRIGEAKVWSGDQLYIPERGWFSRNSAIVAAGITASISVLVTLLIR